MPGRDVHHPCDRHRRKLLALVAATLVGAGAAVSAGAWTQAASGAGSAHAGALSQPSAPTAGIVTGTLLRSVPLSWTAVPAATGYVVKRYDGVTGTLQTISGTCSGTLATTSCVDTAPPALTWRYTVTALHGSWSSAESAGSSVST
jgi:hypothetical protein